MNLPPLAKTLGAQIVRSWHEPTDGRAARPNTNSASESETTERPSDQTRRVLDMVAAGKVSAEEAQRLLAALGEDNGARPEKSKTTASRVLPKFLRIRISSTGIDGDPEGVNLRVPIDMIRSGLKLGTMLPETAKNAIGEKLKAKGLEGDIFDGKERQVDEILQHLNELEFEGGDTEGSLKVTFE